VQRGVPRVGVLTLLLQQSEAVVEPREQFGEAQRRHARGRELERKRYAVEAAADLGDQRDVAGGELEAMIGGLRALREQRD
jgi:hypothetical protein